jgi:predicted regulator of Ras-like GTPase activity (Roadblock/LC7/MglB family)
VTTVAEPTLTPELALAYLGELSTDIRAAAVLGPDGDVAAQTGFDDGDPDAVRTLVGDLFDQAAAAAAADRSPDQVEVALPEGTVYAVREGGWTVAVVAGRFALSSLMFFDLRMAIGDMQAPEPAA